MGGFIRDTFLGLMAIILWSSTVALARSITEQIGPLSAGAAVYLTGGLVLTFNYFRQKGSKSRIFRLPGKYLWGCGFLFAVYTIALFMALGLAHGRQQSIEVGLINYLWPVLTVIFSLFLLANRAGLLIVPGLLLAVFGIVLVLTAGNQVTWASFSANIISNPVAYGLALVAAVAWALYSNLSRRWGNRASPGAVPLFILVTGIILMLFAFCYPYQSCWSIKVFGEVGLLGISTALAYLFWDIGMRRGDAVIIMSVSYITPLLATLVATFYLGVRPGLSLWLGCLLIISGSVISRISLSSGK